eukprot:gene16255-17897_t
MSKGKSIAVRNLVWNEEKFKEGLEYVKLLHSVDSVFDDQHVHAVQSASHAVSPSHDDSLAASINQLTATVAALAADQEELRAAFTPPHGPAPPQRQSRPPSSSGNFRNTGFRGRGRWPTPTLCLEPLGMERRIITDAQITESSTYSNTHKGKEARLNNNRCWCSANNVQTNQWVRIDLEKPLRVTGIAIQGDPNFLPNYIKKFELKYSIDGSIYQFTKESVGLPKEFVGSSSRNLIVYNWFSSEITARYLRILPTVSNTEVCLRLNVYGCPSTGCFKRIGIGSSGIIADSNLTSSTYFTGNEAFKSRFNSLTTWAACQLGSCTPKEVAGSKPWIQLCLALAHTFSAVVVQGHGEQDSVTDVKTFSVQYKYTRDGTIYDYKLEGANKIFSASTGRYGTKQIDLPITITARCLRIKIESETDILRNVGLRWELLGCNSITKTSVTLTTLSLSIARGSRSTVTCSATGQQGGVISYKISGRNIMNSDIYSVGSQTRTTSSINGEIQRNREITAIGPSIGKSFTSCSIMNVTQGLAQCQETIGCSLDYADIPALRSSKSFNVTIIGLLAKPHAPTGFTTSYTTNTSAKIIWKASIAGDVPVESYNVSIKKRSNGLPPGPDQIVAITKATFYSLITFTEYTVQVTAKSRNINIYSEIGTYNFKTDEGVATTPTNVTAISLSATEIIVTWKKPELMNGILHDYQIRYKKLSDISFSFLANTATNLSKTVNKLESYTYYKFQVAARTKGGAVMGFFSRSVVERTQEGPASMPGNFAVVVVDDKTVLAIWNEPKSLNGILHDYQIRYKELKNFTFLPTISAGKSLSHNVKDLQPFTSYAFQVTARTGLGTIIGTWSNITITKTQEGSPTAPMNVTATALSDTVIRLTWNKPKSLNGIIHHYQIRYKELTNFTFLPTISVGKSLTHNVKDLQPFTSYAFQVAATRLGAVIGTWSNVTITRTQEGSPTAPINVTATALSDTIIRITWNKPKSLNGILHNYQIGYKKSSQTESTFLRIISADRNLSKRIDNLNGYTAYEFQVLATAKRGMVNGTWSINIIEITKEGSASTPIHVRAIPLSDTKIIVTWKEPSSMNGILYNYKIRYKRAPVNVFVTVVVSPSKLSRILDHLDAYTDYVIQVTATTKEGEIVGTWSNTIRERTHESIPLEPRFHLISIQSRSAVLKWEKPSKENGIVKNYTMRLRGTKSYNATFRHSISLSVNSSTKLSVGVSDLVPGSVYSVKIAAATTKGYGPYSSSISIRTRYAEPPKAEIEKKIQVNGDASITLKPGSNINGPIAYYVLGFNIGIKRNCMLESHREIIKSEILFSKPSSTVIVLVVAMVILKRRRPSSASHGEIEPIPMAQYASPDANRGYDCDSYEPTATEPKISDTHTRNAANGESSVASVRHERPPMHVDVDRNHQPIAVDNFADVCRNLQKDCHRALSLEYNKLKKGQLYSWGVAMNAANLSKNRYLNVAAYDHSRVHLQPLAGETNIDYINANFISSYTRPSVYIAAQNPIDGNEADFWRMNWDNNVSAIVMLSNIKEGAEKQCASYWPNQGKVQFSHFSVTLDSVDSNADFVIRRFTVTRRGQSEPRTVDQFQFLNWPHSGRPRFPTDILHFRQTVRKIFRFGTNPPVLIHCTDGISRAGTFIAIDAMLGLAQKEQKIDIFNYVNFIRTQRIELVPTEEQYSFIYDAMLEAVMCVSTEFETDDIKARATQLQVSNNGTTGYQIQFELLNSFTNCLPASETLEALKSENERKNRNKDILPHDLDRVVLRESMYENAPSDYVNVTFVAAYKRECGYIATEHPLSNTMAAFWSMVLENNVTTIVMLNELKEGLSMPDSIRGIDMYQFHHWPNHATSANISELLSLLNKLNVNELKEQRGKRHLTLAQYQFCFKIAQAYMESFELRQPQEISINN